MTASLILVADQNLPTPILNQIIELHRKIQPTLEIIVTYVGNQDTTIKADLVIYLKDSGPLNLSKTRNAAAKQSKSDWLLFTDADTYYETDLMNIIETNNKSPFFWHGSTRSDIEQIGDQPTNPTYMVGAAPMCIKRTLFEEIGGYHEGYNGYGFDDSDMHHKLKDFASFQITTIKAIHILNIHNLFNTPQWDRGNNNRPIFDKRMTQSIEQRIADDVAVYNSTN